MIRFRPALILALAVAAATPLAAAVAAPEAPRAGQATTNRLTPANAPYNAAAAVSAIYNAGYTDVAELEWEHGGWDAKATDAQGQRARLRVDAATGAVTRRSR